MDKILTASKFYLGTCAQDKLAIMTLSSTDQVPSLEKKGFLLADINIT